MIERKFGELVAIMRKLRVECPWDREQTNDSIKAATIEEAYEVVESIDNNDYDELKKELGDLLLHIVFHSIIAEEKEKFKLEDVIVSIKEKLIRRHPHVFGETVVNSSNDVKKNWEAIKMEEGRDSVLEGVPEMLPSLQRAHRLQEKAAKVGFDWEKKEDVWKKVIEEIEEMHISEKEETHEELENEIGDVFFAMVNYARFLNVNPENALRRTNKKFIKRFNYVEKKVAESGRKITESNLEEMDKYWNESKTQEL
ncbi:MAG TPA: nucleoside triphosphate pyrophosphohydrolase [Ignavibacteriaceae bacterium]|nr:nucleoside triphosphate pyrophosphohydrolase [Ignavibacteriaceae bacterium]